MTKQRFNPDDSNNFTNQVQTYNDDKGDENFDKEYAKMNLQESENILKEFEEIKENAEESRNIDDDYKALDKLQPNSLTPMTHKESPNFLIKKMSIDYNQNQES